MSSESKSGERPETNARFDHHSLHRNGRSVLGYEARCMKKEITALFPCERESRGGDRRPLLGHPNGRSQTVVVIH